MSNVVALKPADAEDRLDELACLCREKQASIKEHVREAHRLLHEDGAFKAWCVLADVPYSTARSWVGPSEIVQRRRVRTPDLAFTQDEPVQSEICPVIAFEKECEADPDIKIAIDMLNKLREYVYAMPVEKQENFRHYAGDVPF